MNQTITRRKSPKWLLNLVALFLVGCVGGGAGEMLDTAELEEMQQNVEHASQIYHRIIEQYPDSPEAGIARARLESLAEP